MGLDGVELLMKVEKTFSIRIEDTEAEKIRTIGDLHRVIRTKIGTSPPGKCLSASLFRELRSAIEITGIHRSSIRLKKPLHEFAPQWHTRRAFYRALAKSTGQNMPPLNRPDGVVLVSWLAVIGGATATALSLTRHWPWINGVYAGLLLIAPLGYLAAALTRPLAIQVHGCATVADFTRAVLAENYQTLARRYQAATEKELWKTLRHIVSAQLGVRETELTPETRFIEDLNIG